MADRLVVDLDAMPLTWPLDDDALEDLRWYLEDYLNAPFGVYEDRGSRVEARLVDWGREVYGALFGADTVQGDVQLVLRSASPSLLALPWELMVSPGHAVPLARDLAGVSRSLPMTDDAEAVPVLGGQLRVLMVISRPMGTGDVRYQMIARPLLKRLEAVRGAVDLVVLRPPTLEMLRDELKAAAAEGRPYQVVHFDGHGEMLCGEGVLVFERASGGAHPVPAAAIAEVLGNAAVPVVVLNACQSGAVGKDLEAAVATALLRDGVASVVAMAYSVYAVAAAEFMAAFYERVFAGGTVGSAVTAGRQQLYRAPGRPTPKGDLPLADWLVPVHYLRREVSFPQAVVPRPAGLPPLADALAELTGSAGDAGVGDLDAEDGVFVGRDALFYDLEAAARLQKVVVLAGPGGTGKTELAKAFGRWWRDTGGVGRPDWVFWHSFEPGVASFGLDGAITEIGLALFGSQFALLDEETRRARVYGALTENRMLLLWDNFESVREMPDPGRATPPLDDSGCAQIRNFLAHLAAHGNSAVVITSRTREDWLGPVRRIEVGGLTRSEAVEYTNVLLAPYPAAQHRREQRSFGELLDWLDGHPLAMRLALPRLDAADSSDLLAELRGTTVVSAGDDVGPGRLSSLGTCIGYSFTYLTGQARRLLPAVSLFHGIADEDLLTAFSGILTELSALGTVPARFVGISRQEWTAVLQDAARVGLLTGIGGGMYRIHPALPGYLAAAWYADSPVGYGREREVSEQVLRLVSATLSKQMTGQIASGNAAFAYTVIGLQRRTLGAMLGHALDHQAWGEADFIIRALNAYWDALGLGQEADAWADRILAATVGPDQVPIGDARSLWLYTTIQQGARQINAGQPDQAARTYRYALAYLQDQPATDWTRSGISAIYHQLGRTAQDRRRLDEASDWYHKSLAISEERSDRPGMARAYHQLGWTAQDYGRLDEASDWYRKSLAIKDDLGDRPGMARAYHQLGITAQDRGNLEEAEEWYRKSRDIREDLGDRPGMARAYHQFGNIAYLRGRLDETDYWYLKSLVISEELGDRLHAATNFHQLGVTALARGRLEEADEWYRKSLAIRKELGDHPGVAATCHELARTAGACGRLEEADDYYRKSLAISEKVGDRLSEAATYHQLGVTALACGELEEADDYYRKSLAIKEEIGDRPGIATTSHQLGMTALARGRLEEADEWYRKSLAISEELGNRHYMAATYAQLGRLAEAQAQESQALTWNVRCVTLFSQFPSPAAGIGHAALARLTHQLGMPALERTWQQVTGQPLPQQVRHYIASQNQDESTGPCPS